MMYDYLIVGAGLFGSVFARKMSEAGFSCLVADKRSDIGGNCFTENVRGINVHKYGAHIFHTSDKEVWDYIGRFAEMIPFVNSPMAVYRGEIYNLPFNMNTFSRMWGIRTPAEAQEIIRRQIAELDITQPTNLEEQALLLVGRDIYEKLVKGYTEKQWGRPCSELPAFIIKRLPLRFTYDNNYFSDRYQGIPAGGYTGIFERLLEKCDVRLNTDYSEIKDKNLGRKIVYTGRIDSFFGFCYGELEYRSLEFRTKVLDIENFQGNAVVNYTDADVPYTRIIEHKHFEHSHQPYTVISYEYPKAAGSGSEPYYPVNDDRNNALYQKYRRLAEGLENVIFGGRLAEYRYYDMDKVVRAALDAANREIQRALS